MKHLLMLLALISFNSYSATLDSFLNSISDNVGFSFLKSAPDALSLSVSEAGTAGYKSESSFLFNPAVPSYIPCGGASFSYRNSISSVNISFVNLQFHALNGEISISTGYSSSDTIALRNEYPTENALGYFRYSSFSLSAGYAREISSGIHIGIAGRSISEFSYEIAKTAFVASGGILFSFETLKGFSFGISLLNIGGRTRYDITSTDYIIPPFTLRAGIREEINLPKGMNLKLMTDFIKVNDQKYKIAVGAEFVPIENLTLRGAYTYNDPTRFLSLGIGLNSGRFQIDYAFVPYMYNLGIDNSVNIKYSF